jgi:RNA polymerase sigma-70 factor (ECF subfamily)
MITVSDFEELYRTTAPELFVYLRRRTPTDVDDVIAEAFAIAWRRRAALPAPELRRAWLFGAARNLLLSESRRRRHDHEVTEGLVAEPATSVRVAEDGSDEQLAAIVAAALGRLDPDDRELIRLTEWERLTPAELAVALGVQPGTARVRLHRARQALAADPELGALVERDRAPAGKG